MDAHRARHDPCSTTRRRLERKAGTGRPDRIPAVPRPLRQRGARAERRALYRELHALLDASRVHADALESLTRRAALARAIEEARLLSDRTWWWALHAPADLERLRREIETLRGLSPAWVRRGSPYDSPSWPIRRADKTNDQTPAGPRARASPLARRAAKPPSVMRSLGEFFGHIGKGGPDAGDADRSAGDRTPPSPAADTDAAPKAQDPPVSPVRRRVVSEIIEGSRPGATARPREAARGRRRQPRAAPTGLADRRPRRNPFTRRAQRVILRRTIVEEVEIRPDETPPEQPPPKSCQTPHRAWRLQCQARPARRSPRVWTIPPRNAGGIASRPPPHQ